MLPPVVFWRDDVVQVDIGNRSVAVSYCMYGTHDLFGMRNNLDWWSPRSTFAGDENPHSDRRQEQNTGMFSEGVTSTDRAARLNWPDTDGRCRNLLQILRHENLIEWPPWLLDSFPPKEWLIPATEAKHFCRWMIGNGRLQDLKNAVIAHCQTIKPKATRCEYAYDVMVGKDRKRMEKLHKDAPNADEVWKQFVAWSKELDIDLMVAPRAKAKAKPKGGNATRGSASSTSGKPARPKQNDGKTLDATLEPSQWTFPLIEGKPIRGASGIALCSLDDADELVKEFAATPNSSPLVVVIACTAEELTDNVKHSACFGRQHELIIKVRGVRTAVQCIVIRLSGKGVEVWPSVPDAMEVDEAQVSEKLTVVVSLQQQWLHNKDEDKKLKEAVLLLKPKPSTKKKKAQQDDSKKGSAGGAKLIDFERAEEFFTKLIHDFVPDASVFRMWSYRLYGSLYAGSAAASCLATLSTTTDATMRNMSGNADVFVWSAHRGDEGAITKEKAEGESMWAQDGAPLKEVMQIASELTISCGIIPSKTRLGNRCKTDNNSKLLEARLRLTGSASKTSNQRWVLRGIPARAEGNGIIQLLDRPPLNWKATFARNYDTTDFKHAKVLCAVVKSDDDPSQIVVSILGKTAVIAKQTDAKSPEDKRNLLLSQIIHKPPVELHLQQHHQPCQLLLCQLLYLSTQQFKQQFKPQQMQSSCTFNNDSQP